MKVVILCGGKGTRLREETEYRPKPMVPIGDRPILWHIMKIYATHGYNEFILCLGYKGEMIKDFFRNYHWMTSDVTLSLGQKASAKFHSHHSEEDWRVTLADTGQETMTGARLLFQATNPIAYATATHPVYFSAYPKPARTPIAGSRRAVLSSAQCSSRQNRVNATAARATSL